MPHKRDIKSFYTIQDAQFYKARYGLTDMQLNGPHLMPKDHLIVSQCLLSELGNYDFPPPPVQTLSWGFMSWLRYVINHGTVETRWPNVSAREFYRSAASYE